MIPDPPARRIRACLAAALCLAALTGCSSNDDSPPPQQPTTVETTYRGVFAGREAESGTITLETTVSVAALRRGSGSGSGAFPTGPAIEARRATGNVSGNFHLAGGGVATLTGTYETATGVLRATGGGYTFTGTLFEGRFVGGYTRTGNSGTFVAIVPATETYAAYCGTWTGTDGPGNPDTGTVSLIVDANRVTGSAMNDDGTINALTGSRKGSEVIFTVPAYAFTGTISGTGVHGSYTSSIDSRAGGWTAEQTAYLTAIARGQ